MDSSPETTKLPKLRMMKDEYNKKQKYLKTQIKTKMKKIKNFLVKIALWLSIFGGVFTINTFFVNQISWGLVQSVHASAEGRSDYTRWYSTTPWAEDKKESESKDSFAKTLEDILRVLYVLLWPFLRIAWKSLDNDMVYWSVFHLDKYLWMFWNIMKTFANYILWFVFILSILFYFFTWKWGKHAWNAHPKDIIKKLLIWSVLIQASWFIMWALIDVSTILTYAVGAMPLSILKNDSLGNKPMLVPEVTWDVNWESLLTWSDFKITYSCWGEKLTSCVFNWTKFDRTNFLNLANKLQASTIHCTMWGKAYEVWKLESLLNASWWSDWIPACPENIQQLGYNSQSGGFKDLSSAQRFGTEWNGTGNACNSTLSKVLEKSKAWMTWPLYTLYGSLLGISEIAVTSTNKTTWALSAQFFLQMLVAFALIIPLVTLVVILLIRMVVLWIVIWFSPMIFLAQVFSFKMWWDKYNLHNILTLIFLPAVTVFALSISIIFLVLLQESGWSSTRNERNLWSNLMKALEVRQCKQWDNICYVDANGMKSCIWQSSKNIWEFIDLVPWLLINFLWIWLMWTIVFAAMKTSKITAKVSENFEKFGENMVKSAPIVPWVPGSSWAGISSIPWALQSVSWWKVSNESQEITSALQKIINGDGGKDKDWSTWEWSSPSITQTTWFNQDWNITTFNREYHGKADIDTSDTKNSITSIYKDPNKLWQLVASWLDISKLESLARSHHVEPSDITDWINSLINRIKWFKKVVDNKIYHDEREHIVYEIDWNKVNAYYTSSKIDSEDKLKSIVWLSNKYLSDIKDDSKLNDMWLGKSFKVWSTDYEIKIVNKKWNVIKK